MSAEYVTEPVAKPKRKISVFDFLQIWDSLNDFCYYDYFFHCHT